MRKQDDEELQEKLAYEAECIQEEQYWEDYKCEHPEEFEDEEDEYDY